MLVNEDDDPSQVQTVILHPSSRALFRYWHEIRRGEPAPPRSAIVLPRLGKLIPNLALIEPAGEARRFRWRLAGTGIVNLLKREVTGEPVFPSLDRFETDVVGRFLEGVVRFCQPSILKFHLHTDRGQMIGAEFIALPVQSADGTGRLALCGFFPFRDPESLVHGAIARIDLSGARGLWPEHLPDEPAAPPPRRPVVFQVIPGGRVKES